MVLTEDRSASVVAPKQRAWWNCRRGERERCQGTYLIGGHLHTTHGNHLPVHVYQLGLGDLHLEGGDVAEVRLEVVGMKLDLDEIPLGGLVRGRVGLVE